MKQNLHFLKKDGRSIGLSVVIGIVVALVASGILSVGLSSLVMNGHIELNGIAVIMFIIRAISVLVGGLFASTLAQGKHLPVIGIVAIGYLVILLGFKIVLYDESFQNLGGGALSVIAGGISACIIKLKPQSKRKHSLKYRK